MVVLIDAGLDYGTVYWCMYRGKHVATLYYGKKAGYDQLVVTVMKTSQCLPIVAMIKNNYDIKSFTRHTSQGTYHSTLELRMA